MATEIKKTDTPPYISYGTFSNFIKGLKTTGMPSRIDKSVMGTLSGSTQSALLAALKWLGLTNEHGLPNPQLEQLVDADDQTYIVTLQSILREHYLFIDDGSIALQKATGSQVEQKFREYGIQGSTVIKCIGFFLAAAQAAGIPIGPHVKAPKAVATNGSKKRAKKTITNGSEPEAEDDSVPLDGQIPDEMPGFVKIPVPLHGMEDGAVFLPDHMTKSQWAYALKITKFLIENYRPDEESGPE